MIEVTSSNLDGLYRLVRELDTDAAQRIQQAALDAGAVIRDKARQIAPQQTGRLRNSIRVRKKRGYAQVIAGDARRVPYAKVVHFGSERRGIAPNRFMFRAADDSVDDAQNAFYEAVQTIWNEVMG